MLSAGEKNIISHIKRQLSCLTQADQCYITLLTLQANIGFYGDANISSISFILLFFSEVKERILIKATDNKCVLLNFLGDLKLNSF